MHSDKNNAHSNWWSRLGASSPIICAPMGGVAGGKLAAAVSAAGAVGMIGMGSSISSELFEREVASYHTAGGDGRFGIGLVDWGLRQHPAIFERILEIQPRLLSVSFGEYPETAPYPEWITAAKNRGIATITQVATLDEARRAIDAGVEAVVARGLEGGGHGDPALTRDKLLTQVIKIANGRVPVLAAGAINTNSDVSVALEQGAAGVWVGTAFIACAESLSSAKNRSIILRATENETTLTREFDIRKELPWPERFPERIITNTQINAGMGVGHIRSVQTAAEVVAKLTGSTR